VRGDLHDIGKNLVCMMAEGAGFEVHDIGVDQSVEKFMAAADRTNPKIIGMSALLTTTMTYMKTVIDGFEAAGRGNIKMAIGGAPISQMFADEIGADGYGQNASAAVDLFLRLASGESESPVAPSASGGAKSSADPAPVAANAAEVVVGTRSTFKVLYWQEIPSQVRAEDDAGNDVSLELPVKFAARIDSMAQQRGLTSSDAYTEQWKWSEEQDRDGSADEVAAAVRAELEAKADW
jgi:cobalamin-dependent methionine synthase I